MPNKLFIGGEFVNAASGATIEVINPHDCSVIAEIAEARADDVDCAVAAASAAFPAWRKMAAAERGRLLLRLADAIEANGEELAPLESLDTGRPISDARKLEVPRTAGCFRYFGGMADKLQGDVIPVEPGFLNYVQRPFGGTGLSGYGREMGFEAMREHTEAKSVWIHVDATIPAWNTR